MVHSLSSRGRGSAQSGQKKVSLAGAPGRHFSALFGYHFNRTKASVGGSHVKLTLSHFRRDWRVTKVAPGDTTSHSGLHVFLCKRGLHLIRGLNRSVKL